jgi:hypothetical protein
VSNGTFGPFEHAAAIATVGSRRHTAFPESGPM